ncbi:Wadjet anti-phage system protein JetD domain-containing protein, partial [Zoogloea sp. LCSB751]
KSLLDQLLPEQAIDPTVTSLRDHGFERRFGLRYEEPQVRFRLLDPQLAAEFAGASDITLTVRDFAKLDLLVDRVFITENKING